jgi:ribosomal protein S18 acetylase RimI-like enzyme
LRSSLDSAGPALLRPDQIPEASRVIAAAFADDPPWVYVVPDPERRWRSQLWLTDVELRLALPYGATFTTPGERVEGVAMFYPPGRYSPPFLRQVWLARALPLRLPLRSMIRGWRTIAVTARAHPKEPQHWYLHTLGVAPERQRQGVGSFLMAPVLERADAEGLAVYLETAKEENLAYYRRFGFEVEKELSIPGGGPPMWTMLRCAR